jgi:hypothetical protein
MWILIVFLVVLVAFWVYGMITSKDFRDANMEGWKVSKRRGNSGGRTFSDEQYERYRKTGNRNYLIDEDYEG